MPEGLSIKEYDKLIKNEIEPQISKMNLETERIREKHKSSIAKNALLSSLFFGGTLFYASILNHPDILKFLLGAISLTGLNLNVQEYIKSKIEKDSELDKLKQKDFYLLWYARDISREK